MSEKILFLLDENVICKPVVTGNLPAVSLMYAIWDRCHEILCSPSLCKKYWDHIKRERRSVEKSEIIPGFIGVLNMMLRTDEKSVWVEDRDPPAAIHVRHDRDRFLAGLAAQVTESRECIFVSTDKSTRDDFDAALQKRQLQFRAGTIEEALQAARLQGHR